MYLRLLAADAAVKMLGVQTISRKDRIEGCGILRDFTPGALTAEVSAEEKVRTAWRHAEVGRNVRPPLGANLWEQQDQAKFLVG